MAVQGESGGAAPVDGGAAAGGAGPAALASVAHEGTVSIGVGGGVGQSFAVVEENWACEDCKAVVRRCHAHPLGAPPPARHALLPARQHLLLTRTTHLSAARLCRAGHRRTGRHTTAASGVVPSDQRARACPCGARRPKRTQGWRQ